jgi:hypothetical protein
MSEHPFYNGDYIAQAKAEINYFSLEIEKSLNLKQKGEEFRPVLSTSAMNQLEWPVYNIYYFQKYTDEKLSSANPIVYISDLDEIFLKAEECISNYCQLIEKQIYETEQFYTRYSLGNITPEDRESYIFMIQANFCFKFLNYYKIKRKLIMAGKDNFGENPDIDYIQDKLEVKKLLGKAFEGVSDNYLSTFISHILFFKYGGEPPKELPKIHLIGVSQRDLIKICKGIIKRYNWDSNGRDHLSKIFGKLIERYDEKYTPITYKKETIRKNI